MLDFFNQLKSLPLHQSLWSVLEVALWRNSRDQKAFSVLVLIKSLRTKVSSPNISCQPFFLQTHPRYQHLESERLLIMYVLMEGVRNQYSFFGLSPCQENLVHRYSQFNCNFPDGFVDWSTRSLGDWSEFTSCGHLTSRIGYEPTWGGYRPQRWYSPWRKAWGWAIAPLKRMDGGESTINARIIRKGKIWLLNYYQTYLVYSWLVFRDREYLL